MGEKRCVFRVLVGIPEGKRHRGRPVCRWKDNIKMNPKEIGLWGMDSLNGGEEIRFQGFGWNT